MVSFISSTFYKLRKESIIYICYFEKMGLITKEQKESMFLYSWGHLNIILKLEIELERQFSVLSTKSIHHYHIQIAYSLIQM